VNLPVEKAAFLAGHGIRSSNLRPPVVPTSYGRSTASARAKGLIDVERESKIYKKKGM
jgi:hypothetical protein